MDEKTAFSVLEIECTKDEMLIKQAYRRLLTKTNPEDDPEGFKRLRTAYETACVYAKRQEQEEVQITEKSASDLWLDRAVEIYESFSRRIDPEEWEALLEEDVCQDLETGEEVKEKLFVYLMEHYRLPKEIWKLLDGQFFIEEERQQFTERFPKNFVDFMIGQIHIIADFPYHLFQGDDRADYDTFLNQYFELYDAVQEKNMELAEDILNTLDHSGIRHPLVEMERIYIQISEGTEEKLSKKVCEILEEYPDEVRLLIPAATIFWDEGDKEKAAECDEKILQIIPNNYAANRQLLIYYKEKEEYEKAKKHGEEIMKSNSADEELQKELVEINEMLIRKYYEDMEKKELDTQGYIDFGWCCLQNERYKEAVDVLLSIHPEDEKRTGYYSILERLYFSDYQPEKAEEMGYLWIDAIKKEEPSLDEEEKKQVPERIAAAYYIMGRAWMLKEGKEERALECLDKSGEFYDGNEDVFLQKASILKQMHREQEALEVCSQLILKNPQNFWAYVYRMDIYYEMKNGQGVIDNYHRAREIYGYYPHLYESAADTFEKYGQYQDALEVLDCAENLEIRTPKLQYLRIRCRHMEAKTDEELRTVRYDIEKILEAANESEQEAERGELLAEAARCSGNLREHQKALEYIERALEIKQEPIFFWIKSTVLMELEKYKEALEILKICEKDYPDGDRVFSRIGICLYRVNEFEKAKEYHKKALQLNPENERANSDLLDIYKAELERSQKTAERERLYKEGLVYADNQVAVRPEAYFYIERGLFHLEVRALEAALDDFQKAAEAEPENVYAYHNMGTVYERMGQYHRALEVYEKSLSLRKQGQKLVTKVRMAECLKLMGRYEEAEKYLLEYQKEYPEAKWIMKKLSVLYQCMNEPAKAAVWINLYCNKNQAEVSLEKAKMYMILGNGQEAATYLKELMKLDYKPAAVYFTAAQNYLYVLDDARAAKKAAKKALELEKPGTEGYSSACVLLEEIYYRSKKLKRAASVGELLRKSLWKQHGSQEEMLQAANSRWWLYALGESYYYQGDYQRAEEYFSRILKEPFCKNCDMAKCLDYQQGYALLFEARGETEQALDWFEQSLKENPLDLQGLYGRRRLKK